MPSLNMIGPFVLTDEEVDRVVAENKMGNYAYGYIEKKEDAHRSFIVRYVGRSTTDLRQEIKDRHKKDKKFTDRDCQYFKFSYAKNELEAYEKECRNFHDFGEEKFLLNDIHPAKPEDNDLYVCPVEGCDR